METGKKRHVNVYYLRVYRLTYLLDIIGNNPQIWLIAQI